jgi:hypothetical protein
MSTEMPGCTAGYSHSISCTDKQHGCEGDSGIPGGANDQDYWNFIGKADSD